MGGPVVVDLERERDLEHLNEMNSRLICDRWLSFYFI